MHSNDKFQHRAVEITPYNLIRLVSFLSLLNEFVFGKSSSMNRTKLSEMYFFDEKIVGTVLTEKTLLVDI